MGARKKKAPKGEAGDLPPLAAPARRALSAAGITRLAEVARLSDRELLALHGMGPNALATLRASLAARARARGR